ncbi:uncharacterized protein LOC107981577 [Nasonia vitripennis]|uniref:Transposase Helix-turn-helix domain-containing protein n=1 Tax=Nasonia vitripennis TaxID=7425 RepID=A0A7M7J070_NASVI|nr:uncharacterized protein LOC107981577 [Nasonia vitripennis]
MRIKVSTFEYVLSKITPLLMKNLCNFHVQPIMPEERLVLTLRFVATGNTYSELAFSFKMGIKTFSNIISETMNCLWSVLSPLQMAVPSVDDFIKILEDFKTK